MKDLRNAIGFAEKLLELLDEGLYTSTYKFAVLLALIDLCLERTEASGEPPQTVTTRQFADKVVELYWPHTMPFSVRAPATVLRQNTSGQAEIVSVIRRFRERHAPDASVPHWESRMHAPQAYERLVRSIEWKLIEMPLPRLQMMGNMKRRFIYEINWDVRIRQGAVTAYQKGVTGKFDNRVMLKPDVGEYFVQLSGLLRPLIHRRWAARVAQINRLEDSQLEKFLFGVDRIPTARVRAGLWEIQDKRCFYCQRRVANVTDTCVDHFVPWSRYPDDGLDNFVVTDLRCNGDKSNSLAAHDHLAKWTQRFVGGSSENAQLTDLSNAASWAREPERICSVARAIYPRLPPDARLWLRRKEFVAPDTAAIAAALALCS